MRGRLLCCWRGRAGALPKAGVRYDTRLTYMCVFFSIRALRKHLTQSEMRRAARKPHLLVRIKLPPPPPRSVPLLPSSTSETIVLED